MSAAYIASRPAPESTDYPTLLKVRDFWSEACRKAHRELRDLNAIQRDAAFPDKLTVDIMNAEEYQRFVTVQHQLASKAVAKAIRNR